MNKDALGGDLSEMLSIYRACLAVGKMDRAGVILKRIAKFDNLDPNRLLGLHNDYLRRGVEQILERPSESTTQTLHKWFQLEILNQALPLDAETLAYMLKISLRSRSVGDRRARQMRLYMDIAKQRELELQVLNSTILEAGELNQITGFEYNTQNPDRLEEDSSLLDVVDEALEGEPELITPTPQVRPVEQKGLGLKSLKQTLSLFLENPDSNQPISRTPKDKREAQEILENNAVSSAIERWREESASLTKMGLNTALQTKSLGARMWRWQTALEAALKTELAKIDESESKEKKQTADTERCWYGPFLRLLPPDHMAAVTILSCMTTLSSMGVDKGVPLSTAIMAIAESVEDEALFDMIQKTSTKPSWMKSKKNDKNRMTPAVLRQAKRSRSHASPLSTITHQDTIRESLNNMISEQSWPAGIKAKIGAFLMSALIETAKIPVTMEHRGTGEMVTQMQPAFSHASQLKLGKRIGVILANNVLTAQLKREPVHSLLAKHLPMLVQPDPWTHFNKGGFISHPAKMMRIKLGDKDQRHYAEAAINKGDMDQTFKGLDVLGKTSWRINPAVFDTMLEAWNSGEAVANLAPESPKLVIPPEPDVGEDPMTRKKWIRDVKSIENLKSGLHSQRCFQNFQLEIARALRNEEFYFPHNIDFRGRAYPIPPYLNHMGADHCRGLLMFGQGRELGEAGLKWLKIHLANVFGFDKASLKEREDFAMKHISKIYDSASNPLKGNRWWLNAEDPWQFLGACVELKNALESPDPTKFVSHLPIHQDGTCNGLQHYAALGGDSWGAKQVNLEPGDRPADVYSAVANLVKESVAADKETGNPYAEILHGKITRKIVKQTVMTNVYGVTFIGAKLQVRKALVATYKDLPNTDKLHPGILASYIATKIFTALSSMFRGAHDIQYWLGECASRISVSVTPEQMDRMKEDLASPSESKSSSKAELISFEHAAQFKSSVIWTNPLHMPVVQPYRKTKSRGVVTNMQRINISEPHKSHPVSKRKQLQGFPPNFIHSLDATHMLLSALQCDELGLTFAAVHDSFWTHAADVEAMNTVLRDTFVRIHSEDVIGRLAAEFAARYKGCIYLARIRKGTALYDKVKSLRTSQRTRIEKGSSAKLTELMTERKRYQLLNSTDPKEVEEGKSMITPGSLFEECSMEGDLASDNSLSGQKLGEISPREAQLSMDQEITVGDIGNIEQIDNPLPGGTPADMAMGADEAAEWTADEPSTSAFERKTSARKSSIRTSDQYEWAWLPLTFPPVPKKVCGRSALSHPKLLTYI
jgi:DNA-directed RNA polymerase